MSQQALLSTCVQFLQGPDNLSEDKAKPFCSHKPRSHLHPGCWTSKTSFCVARPCQNLCSNISANVVPVGKTLISYFSKEEERTCLCASARLHCWLHLILAYSALMASLTALCLFRFGCIFSETGGLLWHRLLLSDAGLTAL